MNAEKYGPAVLMLRKMRLSDVQSLTREAQLMYSGGGSEPVLD